jgi:hypothetical protein
MTMFLTVIVSLYVFSHAYNLLLFLWYDNLLYHINSHMGVTNARYKFEDLQYVHCVKMNMYRSWKYHNTPMSMHGFKDIAQILSYD